MARRKKGKSDEGPNGPGDWIVTFSDCMTLLLCFFVLLLTFSSFDEVELQKLAGVFANESQTSIFPVPREIKDSALKPPERVIDVTRVGSEMPTMTPDPRLEFPGRLSAVLDDEAHKDRKIFYIPSEALFWGDGSVLRPRGQAYLRSIGRFMRMIPSRVVIGENCPPARRDETEQSRLDRAWAVMRFFTEQVRLPAKRFNITASMTSTPARLRGRRVVAVALLPREVY